MGYECVGCGKSHQSSKSLGAHKSQCKKFKSRQKRNDRPRSIEPEPRVESRSNEAESSSSRLQDVPMHTLDDEQLRGIADLQGTGNDRFEEQQLAQVQVCSTFNSLFSLIYLCKTYILDGYTFWTRYSWALKFLEACAGSIFGYSYADVIFYPICTHRQCSHRTIDKHSTSRATRWCSEYSRWQVPDHCKSIWSLPCIQRGEANLLSK